MFYLVITMRKIKKVKPESDIFRIPDGFDIVLTNPPYKLLIRQMEISIKTN